MEFLSEIHSKIYNHTNSVWCKIENKEFTYGDLKSFIQSFTPAIAQTSGPVGLVIRDDFETYASIIACWMCGRSYVPIQPSYPDSRINDIVELSEIQFYLDSQFHELNIVGLKCITPNNEEKAIVSPPLNNHDLAYILFTSGTTGKPKGVPISFGNLQAFIEGFFDLGYELNQNDKFLQMFELTFDLSVMSFCIPTMLGASFYPPSKKLIKPLALYDTLESEEISFALMVPSAIDMLSPYADEMELPYLKISQFCGEALKIQQIRIWKEVCDSTQIDNVYGPTEATIYCTRYTIPPNVEDCKHHNGIVCIGEPMTHVSLGLGNDKELYLGGKQTTMGYVKANPSQKEAFFEQDEVWFYKSGDIGLSDQQEYYCLGRIDEQVKIQGYRVELAEIEFAAGKVFPNNKHKCVAIQTTSGWELHLVSEGVKTGDKITEVNSHLPWYMHIKQAHSLTEFPLNTNGKVDKKQIILQLGL